MNADDFEKNISYMSNVLEHLYTNYLFQVTNVKNLQLQNEELNKRLEKQKEINKEYVDRVEKLKDFVRAALNDRYYPRSDAEELLEL